MQTKWKTILSIDLTNVKQNLLRRKNWWWKRIHNINFIEYEYRKFLYLVCLYPGKTIVPWSDSLDELWHEHILDTRKYAKDCVEIFGMIIHHDPNLPKGTSKHTSSWEETKRLMKLHFQ